MTMNAPLKVLVIEDEEPDFRLLERSLRAGGIDAHCTRVFGYAELDTALALHPDLVLADYQVPGMTLAGFFWCAEHPSYKGIVTGNAAQAKGARESLGRPKVKNDLIQREQLPAWFAAVRQIHNPVISAYLQTLLLTGARREEVAKLKWADVDFQWNSLKLADKIDDFRMVPLTPYVKHLLAGLPRRSEWVFSSPGAAAGYLADPRTAHNEACAVAGLVMTLHGLRRSFATLCEWTETPSGIAAQIQGHAPQGVREQNYIRRPLDLLRMWHVKIEAWILEQAGIAQPRQDEKPGLRVVAS
jgi:integrase